MENVYITNKTNSHRFALGSNKGKILFVFGVNPSTASDVKLDPTVTNVKRFSELIGFDSFMMLNLLSQRATDPDNMSLRVNKAAHKENLKVIDKLVPEGATIWAAWGNLVEHRHYLPAYLLDIYQLLSKKNVTWIKYHDYTKAGHPKHPARKKREDRFNDFDIESYLEMFSK